jgi:hypothetical protein
VWLEGLAHLKIHLIGTRTGDIPACSIVIIIIIVIILYIVQTGSGVHPTSYKMGTGGFFPG